MPPTSQPHAPPWHQLLSLAGQGATGCVLADQAQLWWVGALLTPRREENQTWGKTSSQEAQQGPDTLLTLPFMEPWRVWGAMEAAMNAVACAHMPDLRVTPGA